MFFIFIFNSFFNVVFSIIANRLWNYLKMDVVINNIFKYKILYYHANSFNEQIE
ncbi:hypothetical protein SEEM965_19313 [Salmonella enterica subsp. enterica serovar Montevideo str. CASC_09SCPH15965]|nr:hypothetical protein SEEM965_19313 [Salmonella enterica subsp. enterica serovar Montevideo str. CASC_09SCPH15965]